ncbi:hypothetical protein PR202_ga19647 [Eleusine coracana subsp. coracana]|uniref:Uncharacterized protein n=1 Tax=Eleusine coracana subsp. coracana TaxID=191504 RepID=A0AAV5CUS8_ELECO|nr:hypothetical protein PR202_ga19647 [Eleusine coracana subsp. coracana]
MDQGMELKGCVCRIKNCAVELFSMEEDLVMDEEDSWDLVGRDLRLKATFLYIDLSRVISCYDSEEHKNALSVLANKFFYSMDEVLQIDKYLVSWLPRFVELDSLGDAVKSRSVPLTQVCYNDTADALREVVAALVPSLQELRPHLEE